MSAIPSDEELMARIASGDESALSALFERHAGTIKAMLLKIFENGPQAEDALATVFHAAWLLAKDYDPAKGKPLGWLVTMARRRAIDQLRKRQAYSRARERYQVAVTHDPDAWVAGRDPDAVIERASLRAFIQERLNELPEKQREAIELAFFEGMTQREIAAATGVPLGTVKTRIESATEKLRIGLWPVMNEL